MSVRRWILLAPLLFGACDKTKPASAGDAGVQSSTGQAALRPIGMVDPFARATREQEKARRLAHAAHKAKRYDEARAAFAALGSALPDDSSLRWGELRAAVAGGHLADVPALWGEILSRDYLTYAGRFDKPKEFSSLRAAPEWAALQSLEQRYKAAYSADWGKGFFFVARSRDAGRPRYSKVDDSSHEGYGDAKLDLHQEAFHYDLGTQRFRRLTATGGQVFAINVAADGGSLAFLVVRKLFRDLKGEEPEPPELADTSCGSVDLKTLATTGPFKLPFTSSRLDMLFSVEGAPAWKVSARDVWTFDAARKAMAHAELDEIKLNTASHVTSATPSAVLHFGGEVTGATLASDGKSISFSGAGDDKPIRAARTLEASSLEWSPGRKRLVFAGTIDACKVLKAEKKSKPEPNQIFLWDSTTKQTVPVASAVSAFESLWIDDDHLVFEGGVGRRGQLHVYDVTTRADTPIKTRSGAGLFGFPSLSCDEESSDTAEAVDSEKPDKPDDSDDE